MFVYFEIYKEGWYIGEAYHELDGTISIYYDSVKGEGTWTARDPEDVLYKKPEGVVIINEKFYEDCLID